MGWGIPGMPGMPQAWVWVAAAAAITLPTLAGQAAAPFTKTPTPTRAAGIESAPKVLAHLLASRQPRSIGADCVRERSTEVGPVSEPPCGPRGATNG